MPKLVDFSWKVWDRFPWLVVTDPGEDRVADCGTFFLPEYKQERHARLIAEAGAVAFETGLTPRELLAQRDTVMLLLKEITLWWSTTDPAVRNWKDIMTDSRAAIAKAEGEAS